MEPEHSSASCARSVVRQYPRMRVRADLRGFFGLDSSVAAGYRELQSRVVVKGDGTAEQFRKIHEMVLATSPNFYNINRTIPVVPALIIE